jgi:protein-disulfide isomerase
MIGPTNRRDPMMQNFVKCLLAVAFIVAAPGLVAPNAVAQSFNADQQRDIERIVRDYIKSHPEVILETLQAAEARMKNDEEARAKLSLTMRQRDIFEDPGSPVLGNPKGDVTLVEFFDYRCPYCKQVHPALQALLGEDRNLRIVMKEFPILGKDSVFASRAALASMRQDKYAPFHNALMTLHGQLSDDIVLKTAGSVGLDVDRLKADMGRPEVEAQIKATYDLAQALEVHGTPAFVIGGELIPGAVDVASAPFSCR